MKSPFSDILGPAAIISPCLRWALDNNLTQRITDADPTRIAMIKDRICPAIFDRLFARDIKVVALFSDLDLMKTDDGLLQISRAVQALRTEPTGS